MSVDRMVGIERYEGVKVRLVALSDRMHFNMSANTDLDGLDRLVDAIEKVALRGDRVGVTTAQALHHERKHQQDVAQPVVTQDMPERDERLPPIVLGPGQAFNVTGAKDAPFPLPPDAQKAVREAPPVVADGNLNRAAEFALSNQREVEEVREAPAPAVSVGSVTALQDDAQDAQRAAPPVVLHDEPAAPFDAGLIETETEEKRPAKPIPEADDKRVPPAVKAANPVVTDGKTRQAEAGHSERLVIKQKPPVAKPGRGRGFKPK